MKIFNIGLYPLPKGSGFTPSFDKNKIINTFVSEEELEEYNQKKQKILKEYQEKIILIEKEKEDKLKELQNNLLKNN